MEFEAVIKSIIYFLFYIVGASKQEILNIKVTDVPCHISENESWHIKLRSDKKYHGRYTHRVLPVYLSIIIELRKYIEIYRRRVLHSTIGQRNDHGYLLVSKISGERLSSKSLSNILNMLQIEGAIKNANCELNTKFQNQGPMRNISCNINSTDNCNFLDIGLIISALEKNTGHSSQKKFESYIYEAVNDIDGLSDKP
jgi:hypothetical protein